MSQKFTTEIDGCLMTALSGTACYEVSGEDASSFLQGQFTNDVNAVNAQRGQLNAYCTPKGRMLAIFYLCQWQDKYYLLIPADIAEAVIQRLRMYVMRSKVEITDCSDTLSVHGLFGNSSKEIAGGIVSSTLSSEDYAVAATDQGFCMQIPGVAPRYILATTKEFGQTLGNIDGLSQGDVSHWQWLDIMSGIPTITEATQEDFVPQMANMELIDGVSFSKGCYPGQEVVARLHYLGNANRRMYRVDAHDASIDIGQEVYLADKESTQPVGKIISASQSSGLAVLRVESAKENLALTSSGGAQLSVMSLPYEIPPPKKDK